MATSIAPFLPWLEYEIVPVMEIGDSVAVIASGVEFRESV